MQEMQRLGIDLMGGDVKPEFIMDAVIQAASYLPNTQFCLFTSKEYVAALHERITYEIVSEVILMEDHPLLSVRKKKDSSLVRGIKALKEKKLDAFISCGNTGALIAASFLHLPLFQSVTKPALLAQFPSRHGPMAVLDVGGNVTAKAELLVEFARVGAAFFCSRFKKKSAQVALLNIGVESEKGTKELQEAYHLLKGMQKDSFTFVGNIEPRDVFTQDVDVLVTS
ncbi:MAG: plsX, partial [Chlamydiia bacterium]|nr:plsX [Chlamydiia bacterium]